MSSAVQWSELALSDLASIADFLSSQSPAVLESQFRLIQASVHSLMLFPEKGRTGRVEGTRELVVHGTPYIVAYVARKHQIQVLAVIHGARRWPSRP